MIRGDRGRESCWLFESAAHDVTLSSPLLLLVKLLQRIKLFDQQIPKKEKQSKTYFCFFGGNQKVQNTVFFVCKRCVCVRGFFFFKTKNSMARPLPSSLSLRQPLPSLFFFTEKYTCATFDRFEKIF